jgi:hypothetical protein
VTAPAKRLMISLRWLAWLLTTLGGVVDHSEGSSGTAAASARALFCRLAEYWFFSGKLISGQIRSFWSMRRLVAGKAGGLDPVWKPSTRRKGRHRGLIDMSAISKFLGRRPNCVPAM